MRAAELFAGVGGFRLGLERAGHEVVWANEWDKYAAQTYDKNFGGSIDTRSITDVDAADIPAHDLIVGGFPCQAFSVAGKRRGFDETRGTLFFDIMRIARHHRTPYLMLENVKGLLNHDQGRTFEVILEALDESGYDVEWQILNSKDFGVPQNRERVVIVGHLRTEPRPQVFPIFGAERTDPQAVTDEQQGPQGIATRHLDRNGGLISPIASTVQVAEVPHIVVPEATKKGYAEATVGDSINLQQPNSKTRRGRVGKGIANTLDTSMHQYTIDPAIRDAAKKPHQIGNTIRLGGGSNTKKHAWDLVEDLNYRIRRLTPVECERLQGFPDNWTAGVSDTQRYKQMGNAVTVNVIEAVARRL